MKETNINICEEYALSCLTERKGENLNPQLKY